MICDSPLYALNMLYYHVLIKKLLQPLSGQNKVSREIHTAIYTESRQNQEDAM